VISQRVVRRLEMIKETKTGIDQQPRGRVWIGIEECKGCGLCVEACPKGVLGISDRFNGRGYRPAVWTGSGCTGCGICFYACPEPGAIKVWRDGVDKVEMGEDGHGTGTDQR
jgi:2-oxoglutarate ferredoxin oxidoreductase subunit delta